MILRVSMRELEFRYHGNQTTLEIIVVVMAVYSISHVRPGQVEWYVMCHAREHWLLRYCTDAGAVDLVSSSSLSLIEFGR